MFIEINPDNIDVRKLEAIGEQLNQGKLAIIPTDTIYAVCCSMKSKKGFERLCKFKNVSGSKANFSMLLSSISSVSYYTKQFNRAVFRIINKALPGPYTFILHASDEVKKVFGPSKQTIGLRIPESEFVQQLIAIVGCPLLSASLHADDEILQFETDPSSIFEQFDTKVDVIVNGGYGKNTGSTVIDFTGANPVVVRQGLGSTLILD